VVDKPGGLTSHDVVARLRRILGTRRVGHAGTLDPMATGVLVCGVGRATRLLGLLALDDKEYLATARLGVATVTDDAEGAVLASSAAEVGPDEVERAADPLRGPIRQRPSSVSAVKVDGRRAYSRVRAGEQVELPEREVVVSVLEVIDVRPADHDGLPVTDVDLRVVCSSGTYVRALARDLGAALGVGGHLTALRRTRVGGYGIDGAPTLDALESGGGASGPPARARLIGLSEAVTREFEVLALDERRAAAVRHGARIEVAHADGGPVAVVDGEGEVIAISDVVGGVLRHRMVLAGA